MPNQIIGSFVLIVLLLLSAWRENNSSPSAQKEYIAKAQWAENRYLYTDALTWYQKALEEDPHNSDLYTGLARQFIGLEQLTEARDTLLKAVEINPSQAEAQTMLGVYYHKIANDFPAAERHYQAAIQADPKYVRPQDHLAQLQVSLERLEDAQITYERLCQNVPYAFEGHFGLASVLGKQDKNEEAVRELQSAIKIKPEEPESYRLLGQALAKLGKRNESQAALKQYQERKEIQNKETLLLRSVRRNPNEIDNWLQLGGHYWRNRDPRKAIDAFERALELDPQRYSLYGYIGVLYLQLKETESARRYLLQAIDFDSQNPEHYNNLGVSYMFDKNYTAAAEAFKKSLDQGSKDPRVNTNYQTALRKAQEKNP